MKVTKGDRFETTKDIPTKALTHWKAPFTDGVECVIPSGTILIAQNDSAMLQGGFICLPENKEEIEKIVIPEETRSAPKYAGYSFVMKKSDVGKKLKKID